MRCRVDPHGFPPVPCPGANIRRVRAPGNPGNPRDGKGSHAGDVHASLAIPRPGTLRAAGHRDGPSQAIVGLRYPPCPPDGKQLPQRGWMVDDEALPVAQE